MVCLLRNDLKWLGRVTCYFGIILKVWGTRSEGTPDVKIGLVGGKEEDSVMDGSVMTIDMVDNFVDGNNADLGAKPSVLIFDAGAQYGKLIDWAVPEINIHLEISPNK
ncbi:unnamed protein product [Allacma fusca]|uniref:Uncharacterized protein n=1 Tax=Allacma fusca TaxID=39272 RepID=A0A8J2L5A5_9HEXA|nr:unnamed protein product [Allacma fusca]